MKKVSIKDIAELSGVSVATVSRVINDNGRFSEETRQKVLKVIEETGYQMNFSAKSLRMNKSFSIGIIVPDISNYFFADVVQKIEELLFDRDYSTIICNTARNSEKETAYLNMLESKLVDGLIVISGADEFGFEYNPLNKQIPFICIDREPKDYSNTVFISSNHYQGAFEAAEALIRAGCTAPAIVMYERKSSSSNERLKGFMDALKKNSIFYKEEVNLLRLSGEPENYLAELRQFFRSNPNTDGLFAVNDNIAMELLVTLPTLGRKIPEDVKVIGFDNTPQTKYSSPSLTSVSQNTAEIAQKAVDYLLKLIADPNKTKGQSVLVPVELVLRNSTK